jgi:mRNA-degrading endonuclease toxin of MazEF toxin-antitoxin module
MKIRQWEIWKAKPAEFAKEHWFVVLSSQERIDSNRTNVNGLACFSLRGEIIPTDVRLNGADGFEHPTICQCDFIYAFPKAGLHDCLGSVSWERQQQIKGKLKEVFRL